MHFDSSPDFEIFENPENQKSENLKSQNLGLNQNAFIFDLKKPYYLRFKSSIFKIAFRRVPTKVARSANLWRICEYSVSQICNFQIWKNPLFRNSGNLKIENLKIWAWTKNQSFLGLNSHNI